MDGSHHEASQVPTRYEAPPPEDRKTVTIKVEQKVTHKNLIPDEILKNELLNSLINESLPRNYNFEVHKTIWKIEQTDARNILLQLPEGLIRFGTVLIDIMSGYFHDKEEYGKNFMIMGDLTYGACCIDDYLASSMGCDLIVHYAHSCLVPINQLSSDVKYLYVFLDIKFDCDHLINCVKHNFKSVEHKIAVASTIQFLSSTHDVAKRLRQAGFEIHLPQSRPLSSGETLGCTAPKLPETINTIVFICDGRFHLEALMIANPNVQAYRYDPYSRILTKEDYAFERMLNQRMTTIETAVKYLKNGGTFGFILGTLGRQGSEKVFNNLIEKFEDEAPNCEYLKIMLPEINHDILRKFDQVDVWVQTSCPRLSIDWGSSFEKPLLNPYEFSRAIKGIKDVTAFQPVKREYPMDFYAKNSCGNHTPNHSCSNNPNCSCSC